MPRHPISRAVAVAVASALSLAVLAGPAMAAKSGPSTVGGGAIVFENGNYGTFAVNARPIETVEALKTVYGGTGRVNLKVFKPDGTLVQHFNGRVTQYTAQSATRSGVCGEIEVMKGANTRPYFALLVVDKGQPPQVGSTDGDWFKFIRYDGDVRGCPDGAFNEEQRFLTGGNLKVRYED